MGKKRICFDKEIPSLFVVASPFQVLCAYEAIQEFEIKDYSIIAVYDKGDPRTPQLFSTLDFWGLKYQKFCNYPHVQTKELLKLMFCLGAPKGGQFKRAFIGDFRNIICIELALKCLHAGSSIVYLDDGNASIDYLKGLYRITKREKLFSLLFNAIAFVRRIYLEPVYYTIFSDIPSKFLYKENALTTLKANVSIEPQNGIFFIGTNPDGYCNDQNISLNQYFICLEKVLNELRGKNPFANRFYVFHGRDSYVDKTNEILEKFEFKSLRLNEIVEMYFARNKIHPLVVAGFMSSALYTINLMCPKTEVVGYMQEGNQSYANICDYYRKHGIEIKYLEKT
jgi:hypothetical protein